MSRTVKTFKDLIVWNKAHEMTLCVYQITENFPTAEKFSLMSQIRRSAVSVPSNIVEGQRRKSIKDSLHFYNIAEGSLEELKYQLLLSFDLNFLNPDEFKKANNLAEETGKLLYRWIQSQKKYIS